MTKFRTDPMRTLADINVAVQTLRENGVQPMEDGNYHLIKARGFNLNVRRILPEKAARQMRRKAFRRMAR